MKLSAPRMENSPGSERCIVELNKKVFDLFNRTSKPLGKPSADGRLSDSHQADKDQRSVKALRYVHRR